MLPTTADTESQQASDAPAASLAARVRKQLPALGICVVLAVMVWAVFGQTLGFGFVNYDDNETVYENQQVTKGLSASSVAWAFTHSQVGHWDPLTTLSHMLAWHFYGPAPGGHHLFNVVLHAATAVALFLVLRQMTGALWRSAFVAAVFAVHPLRAESVAWVTERKDVLSGLFFMLTLAAYAGYARRPSSVARYALVILLFALGLMSKSMLITLPLLLLLLDYWPLRRFAQSSEENMPAELGVTPHLRFPLRHLLREKLPFITISGIFAIIQIASGQDVLLSAAGMLPIGSRIANAIVSYAIYIGQIFCPVALAAFYPNLPDNLLGWKVGLALGLVLSIFACAVIWWQRRPWLLVGWLWFFCMLLPVIGIIPCGEPARADRYTYLPQIGLYLALTWMVADLFAGIRYRGLILGSASVAAIAALTVTGYQQTSHWRDSETLWNRALACTDGNYMAHECLGAALGMKNMQSEAISHHRAALAINPGFSLAANNLGMVLLETGRTDEAIAYFRKAVEITPDYTQARFNLGNTLLATGQIDEAIEHYRRVAESSPDFARVECNLGIAYERTGRLANALTHYQRAVDLDPNFSGSQGKLGLALLQDGRAREAVPHLERSLELTPDSPAILNSLAWVRATSAKPDLRNGTQAVELALKAKTLSGGENPMFLSTLAAAYAEAGRFPEAITAIQSALALAAADPTLTTALRAELALYQAGTPFHQAP